MSYPTPTTKAEMYEILNQIYHDYRIRRREFDIGTYTELVIPRLQYTPETDEQLLLKAQTYYSGEKQQALDTALKEILSTKSKYENIYNTADDIYAQKALTINAKYNAYRDEINKEAVKKGIVGSSILVERLADNESKRALEIAENTAEKIAVKNNATIEIARCNQEITTCTQEVNNIYNLKAQGKRIEYKTTQDNKIREVFKYNNSLYVKETTYRNANVETRANLELKFYEIDQKDFSKNELVDMGYYNDVLDCICAYYDTLPARDAYFDLLNESRIMQYADHFYTDLLALYQHRAESEINQES